MAVSKAWSEIVFTTSVLFDSSKILARPIVTLIWLIVENIAESEHHREQYSFLSGALNIKVKKSNQARANGGSN